jgi:ATP-dependent exoDNAse (exonuclease V) alpha subunit
VTTVDKHGRTEQSKVVCARVELQRTGRDALIEPVLRHNLVPTGALGVKKDRYQTIGSISYMPLRLAYASTVHKIQGLSLDHVQVAFADPVFGQAAMLYVAFSRARSAEGLRIVGTPQLLRERCAVDGKVRPWL